MDNESSRGGDTEVVRPSERDRFRRRARTSRDPAGRAGVPEAYAHVLMIDNSRTVLAALASTALISVLAVGCSAATDLAAGTGPEPAASSTTRAIPKATSSGSPATRPGSPATRAAPEATPFSLPPRTGATLTRAEAARRYQQIVSGRNRAINAFEEAIEDGRPWSEVRVLAIDRLAAEDEESRQLAATPWPADVAPLADALARENLSVRPSWLKIIEARTQEQLARALREFNPPGSDLAYRIRVLLGLPTGDFPEQPKA